MSSYNWKNIIKGDFLVSENSKSKWEFSIFVMLLAIIMITSAHKAEQKVYEIYNLNKDLSKLSSQYISLRADLMSKKMESEIAEKVKLKGLEHSVVPPKILYKK